MKFKAMITKIKFKNYKAFPDFEELELRPVTLIIGKNSSGKSSILKLIALLTSMVNENYWLPSLKVNEIVLGGSYQALFHNGSMADLNLEVELRNGLTIVLNYYVDDSIIKIYSYTCLKDGEILCQVRKESRDDNLEDRLSSFISENEMGNNDSYIFNYIGPIRRMAPENIRFHGFSKGYSVNYDGAGAYDILLNSFIKGDGCFNKVSSWMNQYLEGQKLSFSNSSNNSGNYTLWIKRKGTEVNISEVGQGVAQVLPIVTLATIAAPNSINIIEQPELHLHPAAHANIAELIGRSATEHHNVFVVESHSKNLLLGFQKMIVNKDISFTPDDIAIYYVMDTEEGSTLKRINVDEKGEFDDWPLGVFSESFELTKEINRFVNDSDC